jgi:hypothetical protein
MVEASQCGYFASKFPARFGDIRFGSEADHTLLQIGIAQSMLG